MEIAGVSDAIIINQLKDAYFALKLAGLI